MKHVQDIKIKALRKEILEMLKTTNQFKESIDQINTLVQTLPYEGLLELQILIKKQIEEHQKKVSQSTISASLFKDLKSEIKDFLEADVLSFSKELEQEVNKQKARKQEIKRQE